MLNFEVKDQAIKSLKYSVERHELIRGNVQQASFELFNLRLQAASEVIEQVEKFINGLANSPKEFAKAVAEYQIETKRFQATVRQLEIKAAEAVNVSGTYGSVGTVAGVGVAAFGPTAAMAIATTFGTASTGTAISALSGAAATNAALAWLGGGALAAGGGGMAAGNVLLAMAGPIGWTIGGIALAGSGLYLHSKNAEIAEDATQKRMAVEAEIRSLKIANREICGLADLTRGYSDACLEDLHYLQTQAPNDYQRFSQAHKECLGTLINQIRSLGNLLNTQITS